VLVPVSRAAVHVVSCAIALEVLDLGEAGGILTHVNRIAASVFSSFFWGVVDGIVPWTDSCVDRAE
jgi:hypothetical protein